MFRSSNDSATQQQCPVPVEFGPGDSIAQVGSPGLHVVSFFSQVCDDEEWNGRLRCHREQSQEFNCRATAGFR